jgi:hypothetical protein
MGGKHGTGKGDRYRPVDRKQWDENWEKAFGKSNDEKRLARMTRLMKKTKGSD